MNLIFGVMRKYFYFVCIVCITLLIVKIFSLTIQNSYAQSTKNIVYNGIPWFDDRGRTVNAHGACIVEDAGKYYLFGEYRSDETNSFVGFSCYSSDDLSNWKFERIVLPIQKEGLLGSDRIGERVKVMKCPSTGEYVMYMHTDDTKYCDPCIGYATSKTINGEYIFRGSLNIGHEPIRMWDMGTFQDTDGTGYLLTHEGDIYRLSEDYHSAEKRIVKNMAPGGESPAMFKKEGIYYFLFSNKTSWEKNDNYYFTAPAVGGPWKKGGLFVPEGKLTYNSQTTFVFLLTQGKDTIPMFMGDRWSFPHQASAATYVWLPIRVNKGKLSIPEYWQAWDIRTLTSVDALDKGRILPSSEIRTATGWERKGGLLVSNLKNSVLDIPFRGTHVAIIGEADSHGGYAKVSVLNGKGKTLYSSLVDFYSKYPEKAIRMMTPSLPKGEYVLRIEVTGISPVWTDKTKARYGSDDCRVTLDKIVVFE